MDGSMDPAAFRSTMTSLNHGVVMEAAARNLQREMLRDAADAGGGGEQLAYDMQAIGQARTGRGRLVARLLG